MVVFPGTIVPLHVFEPRYRQMVDDAVETQRMIGVCNTQKLIRPAKTHQNMQDALKNNQATYQPFDIFSAGPCEIVEKTQDGRVYIHNSIEKRLKLVHEMQTLPYRIASCEEIEDDYTSEPIETLVKHQISITDSLTTLMTSNHPEKLNNFNRSEWLGLTPEEFSFKIFQFITFDPKTMQQLLEVTNSLERLEIVDSLISRSIRK